MKRDLKSRIKPDWAQRAWRSTVASVEETVHSEVAKRTRLIEQQLSCPTDSEVGVYIVDGSLLSNQIVCQALMHFDKGDNANAWRLIHDALSLSLLSFKISFAIGFRKVSALDLNDGSLLFCTALALNSESVAKWTSRFILDVERLPMKRAAPSDFQFLCYLFAAETLGEKPKPAWLERLDDGLYGPLLRAQNIEEAQAALHELAINRFTLCTDIVIPYPPFDSILFTHFPIDILAILQRRHSGLGKLHFGCLESPLCYPPAELNWAKPEIVTRVEDRVRELYTFPEVDWE